MIKRIWAGISPGATDTRILVNDGATTLLKARLSRAPAHPRALQWLLESVALWQGIPVRAVLSAARSGDGYAPHFYKEWFPDFGGPLYAIEWQTSERPPRRRDDLGGMGDFRDLKQLQLFDAVRSDR